MVYTNVFFSSSRGFSISRVRTNHLPSLSFNLVHFRKHFLSFINNRNFEWSRNILLNLPFGLSTNRNYSVKLVCARTWVNRLIG